jgi:hypothetical protein
VYVEARERLRLRRVKAPEQAELEALVHTVSERVGRHLERRGLLERDAENGYLALEAEGEEVLAPVLRSFMTYRIALGPHQGRKAFTLRTLAPERWADESSARGRPRPGASRSTPGCWPRPGSGRSSSGCAGTLRVRRWRPNGSRSPLRGRCATR